MKLGLGLPGDVTGGLIVFGIMFTIAIIEMYVLKSFKGQVIGPVLGGSEKTRCLFSKGKWNSASNCCIGARGQNFKTC